uniref:Uncharacterized protein n=1 Tax=Arundo donax TaxID=35708 RepID=A0A0A8Y2H4_ARUDO
MSERHGHGLIHLASDARGRGFSAGAEDAR